MSEPVPVRAVLLGHGGMAEGLVDAVRHITGCDPDAIIPISNRGMSPDALSAAVDEIVGDGPAIIFTDLQSGSCGVVARRLCQSCTGVAVLCAVNLPLLIDFVMNRTLPLDELLPRLLQKGRDAITAVPPGAAPA
jgi:mannose/fructose-specific phosphotransferase system component IIA